MWVNFQSRNNKKFAIRPFLGGVNGISGEALNGNMASLLRRMNSLAPKQDYIVLPEQNWLDGIATSPGIVKQFVATKMAPPHRETNQKSTGKAKSDGNTSSVPKSEDDKDVQIGATVEWQVTGQDTVGGIQLQVIPSFNVEDMRAGSMKDVCNIRGDKCMSSYLYPVPHGARNFDVFKSPKEEGLQVGDLIHIKDMKIQREDRKKVVGDIFAEAPITLTTQDVIELEVCYPEARELIFNIYHPGALEPEISLKVLASPSPKIME